MFAFQPAKLAVVGAALVLIAVVTLHLTRYGIIDEAPKTTIEHSEPNPPFSSSDRRHTLLSSNPFRISQTNPVRAQKRESPPSPLDIELRGIFHLPERDGGTAIIGDRKNARTIRKGDEIDKDVHVLEIHAKHILVDNRGRRESVALDPPEMNNTASARINHSNSRIAHRPPRREFDD